MSCEEENPIQPSAEYARFTYTREFLTVTFANASVGATSYLWSFGDGQTSTEATPTVTYGEFGTYKVTLTINDGESKSSLNVVLTAPAEKASSFAEIGSLTIGGEGAAEITTFDPISQRLFVVNNDGGSAIDIINFSNPSALSKEGSIDVSSFGGGVNSVAVYGTMLAAAIEATTKTDNGKIVVWTIGSYDAPIANVTVGALPDMVTFSNNGALILSANEGEPSDDYTVDPNGSISIITVSDFSVTTLDFSGLADSQSDLTDKGFRIFGPEASFAQDIEPEYITVSPDNKFAYVTLQENNGVAVVDLLTSQITSILPLGFKDYSLAANAIDGSDRDGGIDFKPTVSGIYGVYMPDAIASFVSGTTTYLITANEGDSRDWAGYAEEERIKDVVLDATAFPTADEISTDEVLGRLKLTSSMGDTDGDGDYDEVYAFGARSFSIWSTAGAQIFDSGSKMEMEVNAAGLYDDARSDDKGVEPEGVTVGSVGGKNYAFIGMERSDAVAIYDLTDPKAPTFVSLLTTGDAPEGLLFIRPAKSPTQRSLLVVSSEADGTLKVYETKE